MKPASAHKVVAPRKRLERISAAIKARKKNRERKRRLKQGHRARREARAIRRLRREALRIKAFLAGPRVMFDSVTVSEIPADARAAAGYVGGSWPTFSSGDLRERCPHARLVSVAVASRFNAECLDVEPGDASPADAPGWVKRQHERGVERPIVYAAASEMNAVLEELDNAGIHPDEYRVWTAHTGNGKHICGPSTCGLIPVKAHGTQWTFTSGGRNLDESVLRPAFWVGR